VTIFRSSSVHERALKVATAQRPKSGESMFEILSRYSGAGSHWRYGIRDHIRAGVGGQYHAPETRGLAFMCLLCPARFSVDCKISGRFLSNDREQGEVCSTEEQEDSKWNASSASDVGICSTTNDESKLRSELWQNFTCSFAETNCPVMSVHTRRIMRSLSVCDPKSSYIPFIRPCSWRKDSGLWDTWEFRCQQACKCEIFSESLEKVGWSRATSFCPIGCDTRRSFVSGSLFRVDISR